MKKNCLEVYPKSLVQQNMIFQNMSNHYRKIYNAKPRVDTRPPASYKTNRRASSVELKRSKSSLCSSSSEGYFKDTANLNHQKDIWCNTNMSPNTVNEVDQKHITYHQCCAETNINCMKYDDVPAYQPRILKTNVESKIRNLQVYHPPRRRLPIQTKKHMFETQLAPEIDTNVEEEQWIQTVNPIEMTKSHPSKTCSSDSAYTEEGEVGWSGGESRGVTPIEVNTVPSTPVLEWTSSQRSYRADDLLYVKFLREITEEVLRKGVFTNRALKQIFQNHVKTNKYNLNKVRMEEEIEKLRTELGIPKEDYLDNVNFGLGSDRSVEDRTSETTKFADLELLDALNQLDISDELKTDVANSLGLRPNCNGIASSRQSSPPSPVDERVQIDRKELHIHLPSSDEDSSNGYEVSSEHSESSRNSSTDGML